LLGGRVTRRIYSGELLGGVNLFWELFCSKVYKKLFFFYIL